MLTALARRCILRREGNRQTDMVPTSSTLSIDPSQEGDPGPIARQSLHDAVVNRVRDMIIEGTLPAGSRIHETQLGDRLGVSRTPLREALKFLAREGLVELVPSRGAVVRRFTPKDVRDSLAVMAVLEELAGRLACDNATDEQVREVRRTHDAMLRCYEIKDRLTYFKLNQDIHSAIIRLSGNEWLADVHGMLQARLKRIRFIGNEGPVKWAAAVADHEEMMTALEARDGARLSAAMRHHMDETWHRVKDSL
jgi:DNA-binding GntR family transcriptional regulator